MSLDPHQIAEDLRRFIHPSYPEMEIQVAPWEEDTARLAIRFIEAKFARLYPYQRWHYLTHLIPADYQEACLGTSIWFELAPGEQTQELEYPDMELIEQITPDVMRCLEASRFFQLLDDAMCPAEVDRKRAPCWGDYRNSRPLLLHRGFKEEEMFDVFHVLMGQGGFCDCEILYNAVEESRLKGEYWTARAEGREPLDPHAGT